MARGRVDRTVGERWYVVVSDSKVQFDSFLPDPIFLILYRELYYRHVYSRLQPNIDDRFHSYENSCELFNYLLSTSMFPLALWPLTNVDRFGWAGGA